MINEVDSLIREIRAARPTLGARAAEIEAARRMPPDIVAWLRNSGIFRMVVPKSRGGLGFDQREICRCLAELSQIDGAIGWVSLIGTAAAIAMGLLPDKVYRAIYREDPNIIAAGVSAPTGKAEFVEGGYKASGRWALASGCQHADWMFGTCIIVKNGKPMLDTNSGNPITRMLFLPTKHWQIEDTWRAAGLKGTGSHHIAIHDAFVPKENAIDPSSATPDTDGIMYQQGSFMFFPTHHAAFAIGLAEGAVVELSEIITASPPSGVGQPAIKESPLLHDALGRADADVRAARALMELQSGEDAELACQGQIRDPAALIRRAQTAAWVAQTCQRAIDECFRLAGSGAVYETSPLQRRMRDMHAASQHLWGQLRHYGPAGALLLESRRDRLDSVTVAEPRNPTGEP